MLATVLRHHQIASGGRAPSRVFRSFVSLLFCEPLTRFMPLAGSRGLQDPRGGVACGNKGAVVLWS